MKTIYSLSLAAACGLVLGASLTSALHAASADTPAYFIGNIEQVNDQATLDKYRAAASKTEASFGGKVIARGVPQALDSSQPPKGDVVILRFPSMKALKDWWSSPAYSAVRPLREKSTEGRLYALEGVPAP